MAISYRIVQEHGGKIEVASREGEGTAITVVVARWPRPGAPSGRT